MPNKQSTTNATMPDRLYGEHYPDSFLDVSRSVRESNVATLGDYIRHLQEKLKQPDQSNQPNQSCKSCYGIGYDSSGQSCECTDNPNFQHPCPNNPILTCNCGNPNDCVELGNDPDNQHVDGNKRCPDSGRICNERDCPNECLGDKDGFADNIDYTGIPVPTPKRESAKRGWPCVVVGAIPETWIDTSECISGSEHSAGHTEQHTDAGLNNDGPATTTKL
jgi:hypothetical protein